MSNPFASVDTKAYIKGRVEDKKLVFPMEQPIYVLEDGPYSVQLYASRLVYKEDFGTLKPSDNQDLVFDIKDDGSIVMEGTDAWDVPFEERTLDKIVMMGMVDKNGIWYYYGEQCMKFVPDEGLKPLTIPEGLATETWNFVSNDAGHQVKVAFDGNDVYVAGVFGSLPESAIKGKMNGDVVTFPDGQYLGIYSNHYVYALAIDRQEDYDMGYSETLWLDEVTFDYDRTNKLLKCRNSILINAGNESLLEVATYYYPVIKSGDSPLAITSPIDPDILYYTPFQSWEEEYPGEPDHGTFVFNVHKVDKNYNLLDAGRLYFQIFFDNEAEPYVFRSEEYKGLKFDMSEFPYGFGDKANFATFDYGDYNEHYLFFFRANYYRIGVRTVYYDEGNAYYSNIQWSDGSGVEVVEQDKEVAGVQYFDIQGRLVNNPERGLYIKVTRYTDGTVSSSKIAK